MVHFIATLKMLRFKHSDGYSHFYNNDISINIFHNPFEISITTVDIVTDKLLSYKEAIKKIQELL